MVALATGVAALQSVRSLYDIIKEVRDSSDPDKLRIAASQMFDLAIAAREHVAALEEIKNTAVAELAALKCEIEDRDRFDEEAKNYFREKNPSATFVFREKPSPDNQGDSTYYCPHCFRHRKISMMHPKTDTDVGRTDATFACPECKSNFPLNIY